MIKSHPQGGNISNFETHDLRYPHTAAQAQVEESSVAEFVPGVRKALVHPLYFLGQPGDFVEFQTELRRNPVIETLEALIQLYGTWEIFRESMPKETKDKFKELKAQKRQLESFVKTLKPADQIDTTTAALECGSRTVVTVDTQYLSNPLLSDRTDGTFRVLGKVLRVNHPTDKFSLIRETSISRLPREKLDELFVVISQVTQQGFALPQIEWEIPGPLFHVLPVAIYA